MELTAQIKSLQYEIEIYRNELVKTRSAGIPLSQSQVDNVMEQLDIEIRHKKYVSLKRWFALGLSATSDSTLN